MHFFGKPVLSVCGCKKRLFSETGTNSENIFTRNPAETEENRMRQGIEGAESIYPALMWVICQKQICRPTSRRGR